MKVLILIAAILGVVQCASINVNTEVEIEQFNFISDAIIALMEEERKHMPCNNMAPMLIEQYDLEFDNTHIKIEGSLENIRIDGLDSFIIYEMNMGIISLTTDYNIVIPEVIIQGTATITGSTSLLPSFSGTGYFTLTLKNIVMRGYAQMGLQLIYVVLQEFKFYPEIDQIILDFPGIKSDGYDQAFINEHLSQTLLDAFRAYQPQLALNVEERILVYVNTNILNGVTPTDLLELVLSGSEPREPCVLLEN